DSIDDEDLAAVEEAEFDAQVEQDDEGQIAHDAQTVRSVHDQAIDIMKGNRVQMTRTEEQTALNLFPKARIIFSLVSGLARRIHDASNLNEVFQDLVSKDAELQSSQMHTLARRMPTRWNSEFDCLYSHLYFKKIVQSMTGVSAYKLKAYRLDDEQWKLAVDLQSVLLLFKELTDLFSQAEVPLVVNAIPMLLSLRNRLALSTESNENRPTPAVIRIASQAAILLLNKYLDLMWDCDIYILAIVFCPDRKLAWFKAKLKYSNENTKKVKSIILSTWTKYAPEKVDKGKAAEGSQRPKKTREQKLVRVLLYNSSI
ncbi:hypothetical protein GALMADRAFT_74105, partial [Galerina marginata CBS 339.88]